MVSRQRFGRRRSWRVWKQYPCMAGKTEEKHENLIRYLVMRSIFKLGSSRIQMWNVNLSRTCSVEFCTVEKCSLCWLVPPTALKKVLPVTWRHQQPIRHIAPRKRKCWSAVLCFTTACSQVFVTNCNSDYYNVLSPSLNIEKTWWSHKASERYVNPLSSSFICRRYSTSLYLPSVLHQSQWLRHSTCCKDRDLKKCWNISLLIFRRNLAASICPSFCPLILPRVQLQDELLHKFSYRSLRASYHHRPSDFYTF